MPEDILSGGIVAAARQFYDVFLIILFVFGVITGILATNQGRRFWLWFWAGFLLGPFGLFLTLRVVGLRPRPPAFTCQICGRSVRTRGSRCPECGKLLAGRESDQATKLGREAAGAAFLVRRAFYAARRRRPRPPRNAGD